ncbi:MAG: dihydrodipicolinate reductase C-terminal domain-containing protein [Bdellovibrionota bacterium]
MYASIFSIGVHLFWQTLDFLSKKINDFPQYDVRAQETHHIYKKDQPSGTAKTCQHIIEQNIDRITHLPTESFRQGAVFGDHHLFFESAVDCIEINHKAKSRAGFALGAIACAQWIADKKGFFNIDHYLQEKY